MSRFQELVVAARVVCERHEAGAPPERVDAAIRRLREAIGALGDREGQRELELFSGVGFDSGEGFVEMAGPELPLTFSSEGARGLGLKLLEAAASIEFEADLVGVLREMDLDPRGIGGVLQMLRERRAASPDGEADGA